MHHVVYCFLVAYSTERTLIIKNPIWHSSNKAYEEVFQPVSKSCANTPHGIHSPWPSPDALIVELPIIDIVKPRPNLLPPAIPRDLSERIIRLHGDPIVWWISQFFKYMFRMQPDTAKMLEEVENNLKFMKPIVGLHVRRTDKITMEAEYHSVEEYMKYIVEYFERLELKEGKNISVKRVYVASDDATVLPELIQKYPGYNFIGDTNVSQSAAESTRALSNSFKGILSDIHLLSKSDYLVCTLSSQVCQLSYEIMQQNFPDASDRVKSLDAIWLFGGADEHNQVATIEHTPQSPDELELQIGDVLSIESNLWNGFSKGRNHRSNQTGLYPGYKTEELLTIGDYPTYPYVEL
jgi:glycoprotein 6-alpha-L-fucosyltransferase